MNRETSIGIGAALLLLTGCDGGNQAAESQKQGLEAVQQPGDAAPKAAPIVGLHGVMKDENGKPMAGMMVTAKSGNNIETTVFTGSDGAFVMGGLADGDYAIRGHAPGYTATEATTKVADGRSDALALTVKAGGVTDNVPTSAWLARLPAGDMRQEFILNCGTCHGLTDARVMPQGTARDEAGWKAVIAQMRAMDVYEVIPPDFDDAVYAKWLAENLSADSIAKIQIPPPADPASVAGVTITEWAVPHQETELPHDVAVGPGGRIWITGFWTGEMWALDPKTGNYETFDVYEKRDENVPAQTRALEFDADGILWMINGGTSSVVSLNPATKAIKTYPVGMYAHDIVLDSRGEPWYNDYFGKKARIGHLSVADGKATTIDLPGKDTPPEAGVPLPYGLMIDQKDRLFSTQLAGNTLARYDIATGESKLYEMPEENVGPRRTAIHPDGSLWIPEYNTGRITRFDPDSETFETIDLGVATAGPYDADINMKDGTVWVSGSLDTSVFRVDPSTKAVTRIPLPTEPALIRHMAVDEGSGDLWVVYSSLPTAQAKVARISVNPG